MRLLVVLTTFAMLATSCGGGDDDGAGRVRATPGPTTATTSPSATTDPSAEPTPAPRATARVGVPSPAASAPASAFDSVQVTLTRIGTVDQAVAFAVRRGDERMFVASRLGQVRTIRDGRVEPGVWLDVSGEVSTGGQEQGLLGLVFSPDGRYVYIDFTNEAGDTVVREYALSGGRPDATSARQVLTLDQPASNHNGGHLAFGFDGYLYVGTGDGGGAGDPSGNAQSLDSLLGKLLRISPRPSGGRPYGIPRDNPFVGRSGRDEIWSYGLRNPWRFSFDRATGDVLIGDVGQNAWEEIDHQPASSTGGENYGWDRMEGSHRYEGAPPSGHVGPIYEYARSDGNCAVTGGYVYRGARIPDLRGAYVFADYCVGRLRAFLVQEGRAVDHRFLGPQTSALTSFGEDAAGEVYVLSLEGGVYRIDPG